MFANNRNPFFNFFENINQEVEQMNSLFNDPFFNSALPRRVQQAQPEQTEQPKVTASKKDDQTVAKSTAAQENKELTTPSWLFPTPFTANPFFSTALTNLTEGANMAPPVDVHEKNDSYDVSVSVPGAPKDKITIDYNKENNELVIKGVIPEKASSATSKEGKSKKIHSERAVGKFNRTLRLPTSIDGDNIKAAFKNGVLELNVPKLKDAENFHRIEISSTESWQDVDHEEGENEDMKIDEMAE